jgi:hypothetical protein
VSDLFPPVVVDGVSVGIIIPPASEAAQRAFFYGTLPADTTTDDMTDEFLGHCRSLYTLNGNGRNSKRAASRVLRDVYLSHWEVVPAGPLAVGVVELPAPTDAQYLAATKRR